MLWSDHFFQKHFTFAAGRADCQIKAGEFTQNVLPVFFFQSLLMLVFPDAQQLPAVRQVFCFGPVSQKTIMPDLHEAIRENMEQESSDELMSSDGHYFPFAVVSVILPFEEYLCVLHLDDPVVGNGNTVCIPSEIFQHLFRLLKGGLAIHHPLFLPQLVKKRSEFLLACQVFDLSREPEFSLLK